MNTLLEITMDEFRQLHPMLFSDLEVVDIYCNTGWLGILLSLCDTFQRYLSRYPDVEPVSFGQIEVWRVAIFLRWR